MITKFKKERTSLKSRILKLEARMNQMTYDETLDVKPAKGSKSVQQHAPLMPENEADFDSKSEMAGGVSGSRSQAPASK